MSKKGPIVLIDDDSDDNYLSQCLINDLYPERDVLLFTDPEAALRCISGGVRPSLVLCDMNFPTMTGLQLRERLTAATSHLACPVPFVFLSGTDPLNNRMTVSDWNHAGYFTKRSVYEEQCALLKMIIDYWDACEKMAAAGSGMAVHG